MKYQSTLHDVPLLESWTNEDVNDVLHALQREALESKLEKLDLKECIQTYHTNLLSDRQHVLLVSDSFTAVSTSLYDLDDSTFDSLGLNEAPANSSVATIYYAANPPSGDAFIPLYYWLCDSRPSILPYSTQPCPLDTFNYTGWLPGDDFEWLDGNGGGMFGWNMLAPVRSCYSQKVPERCKASIIPVFLLVVIICNVIKIVSFASALYISRKPKDQPLCTTGDAIQSFLQHPDPCTKGRCLAAKEDYDKWLPRSKEWIPRLITVGDVWTGGRYRWRKAIKKWQWIVFLPTTGGLMALLIAKSVLDSKVSSTKITDISEMYRSNRLNEEPINVLRGFLIGNTPQLVISYLYLALNNIMSTMLAMAEWCNYAVGGLQKGLRVSSPEGNTAQRSSYFLSVPYKWAIPSAVALTILHWLVSQTVFFANLEIYRLQPRGVMEPQPSGYLYQSPLAGAIAGSLGSALIVALILAAFAQKYPANIPLSGCCSASIAAACHPSRYLPDDRAPPREFDPDLAYLKLKWGVVEEPDEDADGIGHATFAADEITPLVEDKVYA